MKNEKKKTVLYLDDWKIAHDTGKFIFSDDGNMF